MSSRVIKNISCIFVLVHLCFIVSTRFDIEARYRDDRRKVLLMRLWRLLREFVITKVSGYIFLRNMLEPITFFESIWSWWPIVVFSDWRLAYVVHPPFDSQEFRKHTEMLWKQSWWMKYLQRDVCGSQFFWLLLTVCIICYYRQISYRQSMESVHVEKLTQLCWIQKNRWVSRR